MAKTGHDQISKLAKNTDTAGIYYEDLCYYAQQAAEKAIKAVFMYHRISFPLVHDLAALITILIKNDIIVPDRIKVSARLTRFAVATRYPHILTPVNENEYQEAVRLAGDVLHWSESIILKPE
ncbi:MAG: DNA-binding protein [Methanomicrobiales archaeon HGW-Methanomicrobiales-3]|jgi:HEPN domain-containing protein|nr:MAG: DNA-binding protein [Methanomicrobiales archaeon HGW-Methanomicrobiales-3]